MGTKFAFLLMPLLFGLANCDECTYNVSPNGTVLVSREMNNKEYGISRQSKSIYCCTDGHSVTWFKDGHPYPWKENVSSFSMDIKNPNQIYTKSLTSHDAGNYMCGINNETGHFSHRVYLKVFETYSGNPIFTFEPPRVVQVPEFKIVHAYCEAFVGKIDLPDAQYKISWHRLDSDETKIQLLSDNRTNIIKTTRDNGQIIGIYLTIENIQESDYGEYVCTVSNAADQINETKIVIEDLDKYMISNTISHPLFIISVVIFLLFLVIALIYVLFIKFGLQVVLCIRTLTTVEKEHNKDYDVCILYERRETNFVKTVLIPELSTKCEYAVCSQILENDVAVSMECQARIVASKCVLMILRLPKTDKILEKKRMEEKLYTALNLHPRVVCLLLQKENSADVNEFKQSASFRSLKFLTWPLEGQITNNMWHTLKLKLPVKTTYARSAGKAYSSVDDSHIVDVV